MSTTSATTILPEKMGGVDLVPVEVGACGTVGSLVMKEIEYFRRLESELRGGDDDGSSVKNSRKPDKHCGDGGGGGSNFWHSFGFLTIIWRRGKSKGGGSGRFLPRMCTMVHVAVSRLHSRQKLSKVPSFSYQNLKDEVN
ncbi:hypothetical protein Hdeb2414_s0006g00194371 [Helianthus debilis subsp. tardiflorus]